MRKLVYISILFMVTVSSCKQATGLVYNNEESIAAKILFDKSEMLAGTSIKEIPIQTHDLRARDEMQLLVMNKWGTKILLPISDGEKLYFNTSDVLFEEAGEIELMLLAGAEVLDKHKFEVLPLAGVNLIESYLGPKTIIVNSSEKSMLTNVINDKYGNPVKDGTPIEYSLRYPGSSDNLDKVVETEHLVSYVQFRSKELTGKIIVGAKSTDASIREQEVRVIAGPPSKVEIEVVEWFPYADSRQMVWLRTNIIRDEFQNVVADGTEIKFEVEDASLGNNEYKSFTIGGIANVYIENPSKETTWNVVAKTYDGVTSNLLNLNFESNIESIAFDYDRRNHKIKVGPIISGLGQHVNDGTEVSLTISKGDKKIRYEMESQDGHCEIKLKGRRFAHGTYALALEVGGEKSTKNLVIR